jgi:hypothetical protein
MQIEPADRDEAGGKLNGEKKGPSVIPLTDFEACVLDAPIASLDKVDMTSVWQAYRQASATTPSPCKEVFELLGAIASIHFKPAERGSIWEPCFSFDGGQRSMIPSDIRGEQSEVLEAVLPRIEHPGLRVRIADVVWTNDKRKGRVAKTAIDAYCDCVEGLMNGSLKGAHPISSLFDAQTPAHRALQIASATTKRGTLPNRVVAMLTALYENALKDGQPMIFGRVVELCLSYKIIEAKPAATDLETVANAKPDIYPEAIRTALDNAGALYKRVSDQESEKRCQLGAVRQMLRMRDECGQAGAKASWVMDALQRLRHIVEGDALDEARQGLLGRRCRGWLHARIFVLHRLSCVAAPGVGNVAAEPGITALPSPA